MTRNINFVPNLCFELIYLQGFEFLIYMMIFTNLVLLVLQTYLLTNTSDSQTIYAFWVSYIFISAYTLEAILKIIGNIFYELYLWNLTRKIVKWDNNLWKKLTLYISKGDRFLKNFQNLNCFKRIFMEHTSFNNFEKKNFSLESILLGRIWLLRKKIYFKKPPSKKKSSEHAYMGI